MQTSSGKRGKVDQLGVRADLSGTWQHELIKFFVLLLLGTIAANLNFTLPSTDSMLHIDGRWVFGFIGCAILNRWWLAFILISLLSMASISGAAPLWLKLIGNMFYALPILWVIRAAYHNIICQQRILVVYGLAWMILIMLCYQVFVTPSVFGLLAFIQLQPVGAAIWQGWQQQLLWVEAILTGIVSALGMMLIRINAELGQSEQRYHHFIHHAAEGIYRIDFIPPLPFDLPEAARLKQALHTAVIGEVNNVMAQFYGYTPYNMIGRRALEISPAFHKKIQLILQSPSLHIRNMPILESDLAERQVYFHETFTGSLNQGRLTHIWGIRHDITELKIIEQTQLFLLQSGTMASSMSFFDELAQYLAPTLEMDCVWIYKLLENAHTAQIIAVYYDEHSGIEPDLTYYSKFSKFSLPDTPCEKTIAKTICCFPAGISDLFPQDIRLQQTGAESYLGMALRNSSGNPIGGIAMISRNPIKNRSQAETVLKICAIRASGELEHQQTEGALHESEERQHHIFENVPIGMFKSTPAGKFIYVNPEIANMLGYDSPKEVIEIVNQTSIAEALYEDPASCPINKQVIQQAQENWKMFENCYRCKDGRIIDTILYFCEHAESTGSYFYGFVQDVTEQRRYERELKDSEARFKALHNASFGGIAIHDKGIIVECNQGLGDLTGYTVEELIGMNGLVLIAKKSLDTVLKNINSGYEKPYYVYGLRKNGEEFPLRIEARNIPYKGKQLRVVEFRDITEQRLAEMELQASEERLRLSLSAANQGLYDLNIKTGEAIVNDEYALMLGYDPATFVETHSFWIERLHPDERETVVKMFDDYIAGKTTEYRIEFRQKTKDGDWKWILSLGQVILYGSEGQPLRMVGTHTDITERKQAEEELIQYKTHLEQLVKARTAELELAKEQAEAAYIAKSRFLANMSHELRTPLNIILGFSHIIQKNIALPSEVQENITTIIKSGEHLLDLINEVLEMSRIEAGGLACLEKEFNLRQLLNTVQQMFLPKAKEKRIDLIFEIKPQVPYFIRTDERKLRQIFLNLLNNAIKFTDQGLVKVSIAYSSEKSQLWAEIKDTGIGIGSEEMSAIFDPFFTHDANGLQHHEGIGLGLPITKKFVEMMGGNISVESCPGKGSSFRFYISAKTASLFMAHKKQPERRIIGIADRYPPWRILIAEDNADNRKLMRSLLQEIGFETYEADNGQDAIHLWLSAAPHLIIMDIKMPVMNGYDAVKAIRNKENTLLYSETGRQRTPIIAVTSYAFEEDRQAAQEAGYDDFIPKPFHEFELLEKIGHYINVCYIYDQIDTAEEIAEHLLKHEELELMPLEWRSKLQDAAVKGKSKVLLDLIAEIRTEYPEIANTLTNLVKGYQFKVIVNWIQGNNGEW